MLPQDMPPVRPRMRRAALVVGVVVVAALVWLLCGDGVGRARGGQPTSAREAAPVSHARSDARGAASEVPPTAGTDSRSAAVVVTPFAGDTRGPPGHAVELTVVDANGGAVPDVGTFLSAARSPQADDRLARPPPVTHAVLHATDGVFLLTGIKDDDVDLRVWASGWLSVSLDDLDLRGTTAAKPLLRRVELPRGASVSGVIVVTGTGDVPAPLYLAAVPNAWSGGTPRVNPFVMSSLYAQARLRSHDALLTLTGAVTPFRLGGLERGEYIVGVYGADGRFRSEQVRVTCSGDADVGPVTLTLNRGHTVRVSVALWGQPVACEGELRVGPTPREHAAAIGAGEFVEASRASDAAASRPSGGWQTAGTSGALCFPAVVAGEYHLYLWLHPVLEGSPAIESVKQVARALVGLSGDFPAATVGDADLDMGVIDLGLALDRYRQWLGARGRDQVREQLDAWGDARETAFPDEEWRARFGFSLTDGAFFAFEYAFVQEERRLLRAFAGDDSVPPAMVDALRSSNAPEFMRLVLAPRKAK